MQDVILDEQYEDDVKLTGRKNIHRRYSVNMVDTQYEAVRRIGDVGSSVLDIGCGTGDLLIKLRLIGFRGKLKGIDKYPIVNVADKAETIKNMDIELEQLDIETDTDPDNWDVGVMVSILCLTREFKDIIKRYASICKKMVIVDVGSGAYPRLNKALPNKIEEVFKVKLTTIERIAASRICFNFQDVITELTKYYETVNIQKLDDAFSFPNAETVAEYFSKNGRGAWLPEPSESKWQEILGYVKSVAQKEIEANGVWREPKPYYVVTAENPVKEVLPYETYAHQCTGS
jgi:SAM-dependent methyltransferase